MSFERDRGTPAEQARHAFATGLVKIVEAEGWLEDAARLSPAAAPELRRLIRVLQETSGAALEVSDLLGKEESR